MTSRTRDVDQPGWDKGYLESKFTIKVFSSSLTDMLSMYLSSDYLDWDVALPYVTFAYNSSRHDTAVYSPFYMLIGREPTLPIDTLLPDATTPPTPEYTRDAIACAGTSDRPLEAVCLASQPEASARLPPSRRSFPIRFKVPEK